MENSCPELVGKILLKIFRQFKLNWAVHNPNKINSPINNEDYTVKYKNFIFRCM